MKAEVLLRRRGETKIEDGSMELNVTMETEQYSPSDFINHLVTEDNQSHTSSPDDRCLVTRQQGTKLLQQTVIRPIPILPIDSSVYTSPPTYIDNIPTAVTVPMMHAPILANHLTKSTGHNLLASQEVESRTSSNVAGISHVSSESVIHSSQDMLDCKWLNCEQQFSCMDDLVMHVNDHHVRVERPDVEYQCKWGGCPRKGKGFNARYKMLIHIRTHTNEKPHKCSRCGKSFSRLENLKIHMRSHTGEKPYTCPFEGCNKAYSNSSDRFKHVRTHQEDKPYICKMPGCNKRYTDPSSLRKHVRTHGHHYKDAVRENGTSSSESNIIQESNNETTRTNNAHSCVDMAASMLVPSSKNGSKQSVKVARHHESSGIHLINISSLISNPFLSSTIVPLASHEIISQTDVPLTSSVKQCSVDTQSNVRHTENLRNSMISPKSQEIPLDLSTCSSSESCGTEGEISASIQSPKIETGAPEIGRWEIIHLSS